MPSGTPVDRMYQALLRDGQDKGTAARIAQSKTGLALATGKPPKGTKKVGAGALNYPAWTTQSQKNGDDEEEDIMQLPSQKLVGKYNQNHDNRGRFSSGSGGGGSLSVRYEGPAKPPFARGGAKFRSGVTAAEEAKYNQGSQPGYRFKDHVRNFEREQGVNHRSDPNKIRAALIEHMDNTGGHDSDYEFADMVARHYGVGRDYKHVESQEPDTPKPSFRQRLFGKFNPNHDERGRFASGTGGGLAMAIRRGKQVTSLKMLRANFKDTLGRRKGVEKQMATIRNRMSQYKRSSESYKRNAARYQELKAARTVLTRELNRLGNQISSRMGPKYTQDWVRSAIAGFPIYSSRSQRPSRKSADADLFEIRSHF